VQQAEIMRTLFLIVSGMLFCALAAFFADQAGWVETIAQCFVPYVAVPFASGLLARRPHVAGAALLGAVSSVSLVVAFYGTTALDSPYSIHLWGPYFWGLNAMISGAVLAMASWWLKPRISGNPWAWGRGVARSWRLLRRGSYIVGVGMVMPMRLPCCSWWPSGVLSS
jgi:peptidoglycan biosynthesis protein MviN/MurJ (putative lipid II flippase)